MFLENVDRVLAQIKANDVVLDIGGWAQPFRRANFVMDALPYETRGFYANLGMPDHTGGDEEHFSKDTWIQRDICSRDLFPFKDKSVDYVICSHVLEDIRDPLWVCAEMIRIAKRGYIEMPSRIAESIVDRKWKIVGASHHRWLVTIVENKMNFEMKYHLIHKKGMHLPHQTLGLLKPEQCVQWLFWENSFGFEEASIPLGEQEVERRLRDFVKANSLAVPLGYRILRSTFYSVNHVIPGVLVKKLERIGSSYRRKFIRS